MKTTLVWRRLLIEDHRIVTSAEIHELAKELGKDGPRTVQYLQRHGYILRIFRGIYYVRNADERMRGFIDASPRHLMIKGLELKGVRNWFFGLETALKLNLMTHEYFFIDFVITDSYWTSAPVQMITGKVQFLKWKPSFFMEGLVEKDGIRFTGPERTVLDLTYRNYRRASSDRQILSPILEFQERLEKEVFLRYLQRYPLRFQRYLRGVHEGHSPDTAWIDAGP